MHIVPLAEVGGEPLEQHRRGVARGLDRKHRELISAQAGDDVGFSVRLTKDGGGDHERRIMRFTYLFPYGYAAIDYTTEVQSLVNHQLPESTRVLALGCFAAFTLAGYVLYVGKNERG